MSARPPATLQRHVALGILLFALLAFSPGVEAAIENFDTTSPTTSPDYDGELAPPKSPYYTFSSSSVNAFVTSAEFNTGGQSLRMKPTTSGGTVTFTLTNGATFASPGTNCVSGICDYGAGFAVWLKLPSLPPTGTTDVININHGGGECAKLQITDAGEVRGYSASGTTQPLGGSGVTPGQWFDLQIFSTCPNGATPCCAGGTWKNLYRSYQLQFATEVFMTAGLSASTGADSFYMNMGSVTPFSRILYMDRLEVPGLAPSAYETYASAAQSALYDGINALAVDGAGNTAIIRVSSGGTSTVKALNAIGDGTTLTEVGSVASGCNLAGGVDAIKIGNNVYTSYTDCVGNAQNVDRIKIRSGTLGTPIFDCASCSDSDIEDTEDPGTDYEVNIPDSMGDIGTISTRPYSFSSYTTGGTNHGTACWTFTSRTTNEVGLFCVVVNNNGDDFANTIRRQLATGSLSTQDMCSFTFGDLDYMLGANSGGQTALWNVGTVVGGGVGELAERPDNFMNQVFSASSVYAPTSTIACSNTDKVAIVVGTSLYVVDVIGGTPTQAIPPITVASNPGKGGVAMSGDGAFMTVLDGSTFKVYRVSNGTLEATFTAPAGSVIDTKMDQTGGNVWVAMNNGATDRVYKFTIAASTCGTNCASTVDDRNNPLPGGGTGTNTASGTSSVAPMFRDGVSGIAAAAGIPEAAAALIFGLLGVVVFVGIFAIPTFLATQRSRHAPLITILVGTAGGSVGMLVWYSFGTIPGYVVTFYVLLLLVLGVVGAAMLARR